MIPHNVTEARSPKAMFKDPPGCQTIVGCVLCKTRAAVEGHEHCPACLARVVRVLRDECRAWRKLCQSHDHYGAIQSNPSLAFILSSEDRAKLVAECKADRTATEAARADTNAINAMGE